MRPWAHIVLAAAFLTIGGSAVPASADPVADLSVSIKVLQGWGEDSEALASPDITIGERLSFQMLVHNPSTQTVEVRMRFRDYPSWARDVPWWDAPLNSLGSTQAAPPVCDTDYRRCDFTIAPGRNGYFLHSFEGNAPGPYTYDAVLDHPADPDQSDNRAHIDGSVSCSIEGTAGPDVITGTDKRDSICAGAGDDVVRGLTGGDKVYLGRGDDVVINASETQRMFGGPGADLISFARANKGVKASLKEHTAAGMGADFVEGFDAVRGSRFDDYIEGSGNTNLLIGGRGDDELFGRGGQDLLGGGRGRDLFSSRDGIRDVIKGGPSPDRSFADTLDRRSSVAASLTELFDDRDPLGPRPG